MAVPTKEQCKLKLSFDMVAKTMTVSVQSIISTDGIDGLTYTITGGTLVDPLGDSIAIDDIGYDGNGGVGTQTYNTPLDSSGLVLSKTLTLNPPDSNSSTRWVPMKPEPPVTRTTNLLSAR